MEQLIRQATEGDTTAIVSCTRAAYRKYVARLGYELKPMVADHGGWIADGRVWVLTEDSAILGVLVLIPEAAHLLLYSIAVQPAAQGRGLGRRLMAFVESHARDQGFREIRLYTNELMTENIAFYERLCYERFERLPHPIHAGSWLIHMRKAVDVGDA